MKPLDIVRLPKTVVERGQWKVTTGTSKMPDNAYALTKRASFTLRRGWHWRVDVVAADGMQCRLLTAFNNDREEFLGWLSVQEDDGLRVIARYEYHGTHPGWHCHTADREHEELPVGDPRPRDFGRELIEADMGRPFTHMEDDALARSFGFFNVTAAPEGALI